MAEVPLDLFITVCGHADENCPAFLTKAKLVHVGFDDPPKLAKEAAKQSPQLAAVITTYLQPMRETREQPGSCVP